MGNQEYNSDTFFGRYEGLIRQEIGKELENLNRLLHDISGDSMVNLMNIKSGGEGLTVQNLLDCSSEQRCHTVSAILYDEALWRLEAAYLMVSIGLLNIAYANLRESLEALVAAFIVQRIDSEARKFLEGKKVNPTKIEAFLQPNINQQLKDMDEAFSKWGVHTSFESVQLTTLFGPGRFNKIVAGIPKVNREIKLPDGFVDVASTCIKHARYLVILFVFLLKKPLPKITSPSP